MSRKSHLAKQREKSEVNKPVPSRVSKAAIEQIVEERIAAAITVSEHRSGPLPDAAELKRYDEISPGFANEILQMAKKNQDYLIERDREEKAMQKNFADKHQALFGRGQICGTIVAVGALIAGTVIALNGAPTAGASVVGATMAILVGAFAFDKWHSAGDNGRSEK